MTAESNTITLALTHDELEPVRAILGQYGQGNSAFVFGSRVVASVEDQRRVKPYSDLDIALAEPLLTLAQMDAMPEAFSESDLPMRVDIAIAADLPEEWKKRVWPL